MRAIFPNADPFPASWTRFFSYAQPGAQLFTAPGATFATPLLLTSDLTTTTMPSAAAPASPIVGAVPAITINGASLSQPLAGVGTTPMIAWQAANGVTNYRVRIWSLAATPDANSVLKLALHFQTTGTSVRVPPGVLAIGTTYVIQIGAFNMPVDWTRAPLRYWPTARSLANDGEYVLAVRH